MVVMVLSVGGRGERGDEVVEAERPWKVVIAEKEKREAVASSVAKPRVVGVGGAAVVGVIGGEGEAEREEGETKRVGGIRGVGASDWGSYRGEKSGGRERSDQSGGERENDGGRGESFGREERDDGGGDRRSRGESGGDGDVGDVGGGRERRRKR